MRFHYRGKGHYKDKKIREGEMIIFKASGVRMTDISMAILNLEEQSIPSSEQTSNTEFIPLVNY